MRPTVLVVDDHDAFRASAAALLEAEGFAVVGVAGDGRAAIEASRRLRPGVVLLDIQLPDLDGFAVAEQLLRLPEPPRVVLISTYAASTYGERLRSTPASGFINKQDLSGSTLAAALVS
jgi:DNA-binding NarL/FixJ family response regulator